MVIFDGYNFLHRARVGSKLGDHGIVYNFFRSLRASVEKHAPTRAAFVLEGRPQFRYDLLSEYKANRKVEVGTEKHTQLVEFHKQKEVALDILKKWFPLSTVSHSQYECDDVVFNLINSSTSAVDFTVVSTDSDFMQLLNEFSNVTLYNPTTKCEVSSVEYDYVIWKALRGDPCDNVPGIPGVGNKTAEKLARDEGLLRDFLSKDSEKMNIFLRNIELIKFKKWTDQEAFELKSSSPIRDWDAVKDKFSELGFSSLVKEDTFNKFTSTFDVLWSA